LVEVATLWCETANHYTIGASFQAQHVGNLTRGNSAGIGAYFFKHGFFKTESELRDTGNLDPFDCLRLFLSSGDISYLIFWLDFELATVRQNRIRFSSNFPFVAY
jgi:hypothetical protein